MVDQAMADRDVIRLVEQNAAQRAFDERVERNRARIARKKIRLARLRMLEKTSYVACGGMMAVTMAGIALELPGLAAVTGTVVTAVLFALGESFAEMQQEERV